MDVALLAVLSTTPLLTILASAFLALLSHSIAQRAIGWLVRSTDFAIPFAAALAAAFAALAIGIGPLTTAATFRSLLLLLLGTLRFALLARLAVFTRLTMFPLFAGLHRTASGHPAEGNRTSIGRLLRSPCFRHRDGLAKDGRSCCGLGDRE